MKFIHSSDWHIGRQFHNVSLLDDQRHVLDQLLVYLVEHKVDVLLISGDIYDRSVPPSAAVALLDEFLSKIVEGIGIPVILIPGNHDGAERLSFGSTQLKKAGLHILGDLENCMEPVVISRDDVDVAFYGLPYNDHETIRSLFSVDVSTHDQAHEYMLGKLTSALEAGRSNVLLSHCFIDGATEADSERPLSIGGADRVSYEHFTAFDYAALGHLHSPQYKGTKNIRYCGSLLKYSFSEQHQKKGVELVEVDKNGVQSIQHLPLTPLRNMRILEGPLADIIEQGKNDPNNDDYLLVRMTDRHAILDPMAKLRTVYPNVLQLEKPGMLETGDLAIRKEQLKQGEHEMFRDFFKEVSGQALSDEQNTIVVDLIKQLRRNDGGLGKDRENDGQSAEGTQ